MTVTIRPFDLPVPRGAPPATGLGLAETPSPTLGAIVCAMSSFDTRGHSVSEDDKPAGAATKIVVSSLLALLGGVVGGGILGVILSNLLPTDLSNEIGGTIALPPMLICAVLTFIYCFTRYRVSIQRGDCHYAGVDGVERITLGKSGATRSSVRYLDDVSLLRDQSSVTRNGAYSHDTERIRFMDASGKHAYTQFARFSKLDPPDADTLFAREVAALAAHRRTESARAKLAKGEPLIFRIFEPDAHGTRLGPRRLELRGDAIELHDATATPSLRQRFARGSIGIRLNQGQVEIVPQSSAEAGAVFEREYLGDSDVLLALHQPA